MVSRLIVLSRVKCDKGDVDDRLSSNHLIYACDDLFVHIALLLTSLITHGFTPDIFLRSKIRPIPKGHNQNLSDSTITIVESLLAPYLVKT